MTFSASTTLSSRFQGLISGVIALVLGGGDLATEGGRSLERHRRVFMTAGASVLAKSISVGTALISVPLTLHYLGAERYGMWMTMSSLVAILSFADLGIGNGMLNVIAAAFGREDRMGVRAAISSGFFSLAAVAFAMAAGFALVYPVVPWARLFNVRSHLAQTEAGPAWAIFVLCFLAAIPANLGQRVQGALQRGFVSSLWQCAASVLALAAVLLVIAFKGGLMWLVLAYVGTPLLIGALNSALYFVFADPDLRPRWALANRTQAMHILRIGLLFFFLQIAVSINYGSDDLIISQVLGPAAVPDYAIPERMFSTITMVMTMFLLPLWPAYAEAMARGEDHWARRTLMRSLVLAGGATAACVSVLVLVGRPLLIVWIGRDVNAPMSLLALFAIWKVVEVCGIATAMFLNAAQVAFFLLSIAVLYCSSALMLKIYLIEKIGIIGLPVAVLIAHIICSTVPTAIFILRKPATIGTAQ